MIRVENEIQPKRKQRKQASLYRSAPLLGQPYIYVDSRVQSQYDCVTAFIHSSLSHSFTYNFRAYKPPEKSRPIKGNERVNTIFGEKKSPGFRERQNVNRRLVNCTCQLVLESNERNEKRVSMRALTQVMDIAS